MMMLGRVGWELPLASLVLAFALSLAIALVYNATYHGVGYVRSFGETLALAGIVSALVMLAVGDDIARGLGVVGALTLIRFRSNLKDTRDLIFVFTSLGVGIACGVQAFGVALVGTVVFSVSVALLALTRVVARPRFDAVLRLRGALGRAGEVELLKVLERHCRALALLEIRRDQGDTHEYAYQVQLARSSGAALVRDVESLPGVQDASMFTQDESLEM